LDEDIVCEEESETVIKDVRNELKPWEIFIGYENENLKI
jgi:hypothetical protein